LECIVTLSRRRESFNETLKKGKCQLIANRTYPKERKRELSKQEGGKDSGERFLAANGRGTERVDPNKPQKNPTTQNEPPHTPTHNQPTPPKPHQKKRKKRKRKSRQKKKTPHNPPKRKKKPPPIDPEGEISENRKRQKSWN